MLWTATIRHFDIVLFFQMKCRLFIFLDLGTLKDEGDISMNETQNLEISGRWRSHCAIELNLNLNRIY